MIPVRWLTAGKSSPESGSRRRDVGEVPVAQRAKCGMCERTLEVSPDPRLVAQIVRLAIAAVEAGKRAEQARVGLRRHDCIEIGGDGRGANFVARAARPSVERQQPEVAIFPAAR